MTTDLNLVSHCLRRPFHQFSRISVPGFSRGRAAGAGVLQLGERGASAEEISSRSPTFVPVR